MSLIPSHRRHIVFMIFHILQADDKHKQSTGCDMSFDVTSVLHRIGWLMNTTAQTNEDRRPGFHAVLCLSAIK